MGLRILYGVQGTGNGHISRSREIIRNLKADGHDVQVIVSGRDPALLWEMEVFEPFVALEGLTFSTKRGRLQYLKTARRLNFFGFYSDIRRFDARGVDVVITDFEPVSARIARRHRLPSIGIGHQYAFRHRIPIAGFDPAAMYVIRNFAPAELLPRVALASFRPADPAADHTEPHARWVKTHPQQNPRLPAV